MRLGISAVTISLALSGCTLGNDVVEQTSRDLAKGVVNGVVQQNFPGVNAAPYTDCVIDNASSEELFRLAKGTATGANDAATSLVLEIAARPATSQCIAQAALGAALGQ